MKTCFSSHSVYRTEYHIIWITKYRRRVLNLGVSEYLKKVFPKILRSMPGCEMLTLNIQREHIHMVMVIPPKYAVSEVVGRIKCQTASQLRKRFAWLGKVYWNENIVWSPSFFVSTVGIDEATIMKYVEWQGRQDSGQMKFEF